MIHRCTPKCHREDGTCSLNFPKPFSSSTVVNEDSYALPRRRRTAEGGDDRNSTVVPYNSYLMRRYDCHINVEICFGIKAVKYIHKYLHKGNDRCWVDVHDQNDEISAHLNSRYVGSMEAVYRICKFKTHTLTPSVMLLNVHEEGQTWMVFNPNAETAVPSKTPLIGFFEFNAELNRVEAEAEAERIRSLADFQGTPPPPPPPAPRYTYEQFPEHYTWDKSNKLWRTRGRNHRQFGRLAFVYPGSGERFYLRMLLNVVRGASSFQDLRTVPGFNEDQPFATFREACRARGLLDHDTAYIDMFAEADRFQTPKQLRYLFVCVLPELSEPDLVLRQFQGAFMQDLGGELQRNYQVQNPSDDECLQFLYFKINDQLERIGKSNSMFNLPDSAIDWTARANAGVLTGVRAEFFNFPGDDPDPIDLETLNPEQRTAFDTIVNMVMSHDPAAEPEPRLHFLNGPGGTGKTYVYQKIFDHLRAQRKVVMCVASSGCAALLLPKGSTAHHRFKIPLEVDASTLCNVKKQSILAECLLATDLFIWDEATLQNRHVFETVDRTMRDLTSNPDVPFGGKAFLFGGDWSQCLPVIPGKNQSADIVPFTLKRSYLWPDITVLRLVTNMRLNPNSSVNNAAFSSYLANISRNPAYFNELLDLPDYLTRVHTAEDLIDEVFPLEEIQDPRPGSAIITFTNRAVNIINAKIFEKLDTPEVVYRSTDTIYNDNVEFPHFAQEGLNKLEMKGLPQGILPLKVNAIIMLLRNLNTEQGLCNGTRLKILDLTPSKIVGSIMGGDHDQEVAIIPRMTLQSTDGAFVFKRKQFPVRLAYAMTVHKSQGQSLARVGVDLMSDVFVHGLLYVALSRATNTDNVFLLTPIADDFQVKNVVFPEVVDDIVDEVDEAVDEVDQAVEEVNEVVQVEAVQEDDEADELMDV
ncbi:unnamed protein product [Ambrosiozyma monospora]|uniref:ATP-dependent DNA helicase n=1 Tax=Ambrosiozyma monospora TaxID=43982 RepID=A0A9W7DEL4_AMBMO|nr:unnamed protein product [Ambrosiozyma monospora]